MKLKPLPLILSLLFAFGLAARAQDDGDGSTPISVKITKYPDHSYSAMKTDMDSHSAENSKYNSDGVLQQTTVFVLDDQGRAIGGFIYAPKGTDPKGTLLYKTRYVYDDQGRVSQVYNFSTTDQLESRQVYHYDATGKVTKIETFDPSGNLNNTTATAPQGIIPNGRR